MKRILAMAIGPKDKSETLLSKKAARAPNLRRYIQGLVEGLSEHGQEIGKTFEINYAEHPIIAAKHFTEADLVFGMSTTVVRAAQEALGDRVPILGIVSDRKVEQFDQSNIACFSARRSQSADDCFRRFMVTVPTLRTVHVLHKEGYGPSERGVHEIKQAAQGTNVDSVVSPADDLDQIKSALDKLDARKKSEPATAGVLVQGVDLFLSQAAVIIDRAQTKKRLPVFIGVPEWVRADGSGALGAYGISQQTAGVRAADQAARMLWPKAKKPLQLDVLGADEDFEWVVSKRVADELKIHVSIPRLV